MVASDYPDVRSASIAADDWCWLVVMAGTTAAELIWWGAAWAAGIAPLPFLMTYVLLSFAALGAALGLRAVVGLAPPDGWSTPILGAALVGVGASLFLPLKFAIPAEVPFWLDAPLAAFERGLFGADPWLLLDRLLGGVLVPVDRVYALWLPVQTLVLFLVMLQPASPAKARLLIAYTLAWFLMGVVGAVLFSSAGPIFYDRLLGGDQFASLHHALRSGGATFVLAESDRMWASFATARPGIVAGMSALPSLHVGISLWIYLAARREAPRWRWAALTYFIFIWIASVQLGWHYVSDGLAASVGMLAIWRLAAVLNRLMQRLVRVRRRPHPALD